MKYLKILMLLCVGLFSQASYAEDPDWDNFRIDGVQFENPVNFLSSDKWNYYSRYSDKLKVKIVDYGILNRSSGKENYQLQKYGVEILNKNKIYQLFKTTNAYNDKLWVRVSKIFLDEEWGIIALTVKTNSYVNYGTSPFKQNEVTTYVYNLKTNKILELKSIFASSSINKDGTSNPIDCSIGSMIDYNDKTKLFTFTDRIQKGCEGPINEQTIKKMPVYKVTFDRNLKCVSTNDVAGGCTDEDNINESIYNYPAEFVRMKKK